MSGAAGEGARPPPPPPGRGGREGGEGGKGGRESAGGGGRGTSLRGRMRGSRLPREAAGGSAGGAGRAEARTAGSPCGDRCSLPSTVPRGARPWRRPPITLSWCRWPREGAALSPGPCRARTVAEERE